MLNTRTISLTVFLAITWLLLSGHYDPLMLSFGLISVVFVVYIARRMDLIDHEGHPVHLTWRAPVYWVWLIWQVIISNFQVALHVCSPKLKINPKMILIPMGQEDDLDRTNYANSITLTPGTVSVRLDDDGQILVHALDEKFAESLKSGIMEKNVKKMSNTTTTT